MIEKLKWATEGGMLDPLWLLGISLTTFLSFSVWVFGQWRSGLEDDIAVIKQSMMERTITFTRIEATIGEQTRRLEQVEHSQGTIDFKLDKILANQKKRE